MSIREIIVVAVAAIVLLVLLKAGIPQVVADFMAGHP